MPSWKRVERSKDLLKERVKSEVAELIQENEYL
jgi:hypothetical protein